MKPTPLKVKTMLAEKEDSRILECLRRKGIKVHLLATHASYQKGKRPEHRGVPKPMMYLLKARKDGVMHPIAYGRTVKQLAANLATGNSKCPSAYRQNAMGHWTVWEEHPYSEIKGQ